MTTPQFPIVHKGVPVPYIALWTGEKPYTPNSVTSDGDGICLADEKLLPPSQRARARDRFGVTWQRYGLAPGRGEPLLGQVHAFRQKRCMLKGLCQVCATAIPRGEGIWVLQERAMAYTDEELAMDAPVLTTPNPHVCEPCYELASSLCPSMMGGHLAARATAWGVTGIVGELFDVAQGTDDFGRPRPQIVARGKDMLFFGDPRLKWMLGGQLAATLMGPLAPVNRVDRKAA